MRILEIDSIESSEYIQILSAAIKHYGAAMQEDIAIEEMSELTQAIIHFRRGREHNIAEEIADVEIMLEQLKIIYQCAPLTEHYKAVKIARLQERIENNE